MKKHPPDPRILIITPEVTYLPAGMGNMSNYLNAKAGGLADVSAALISKLFEQGADVHVALPDYRTIFNGKLSSFLKREENRIRLSVPGERIHLAEDRSFFYREHIYSNNWYENINTALAFQREVINNIIPRVRPDLIHCNDWMTGLIPAMSRHLGIPCLFTVHNIHSIKTTLSHIEDRGIDSAIFWSNLYYERMPSNYEETRNGNCVDLLTSGVFSAHFVNTVSPTFLNEIVMDRHDFIDWHLRKEISNKWNAGCASGILNAPDPAYSPEKDKSLARQYQAHNHSSGKMANKTVLQKTLGLVEDEHAPVYFWPSRLDAVQKGCRIMSEILYDIVSKYWKQNLEVIFIANGEFQDHFKRIVKYHGLERRVSVCDFDEKLTHLAYGASDFVLMPSLFEPCGLPQMIGPIYGALPIAHDTGGIHDTICDIDVDKNTGNGFLFEYFDSNGLMWAIKQSLRFYRLPNQIRLKQIRRIMQEGKDDFNHSVTAENYVNLYEKMLHRPLVESNFMGRKAA